jgi:hypothetical protein
MIDTNRDSVEAPGGFEPPNEGFAGCVAAATHGQPAQNLGVSPNGGGLPRTAGAVRDREWSRRAAAARWGTLAERFASRVRKHPGDACWTWAGAHDTDGYGRLEAFGAKHAGAHRVAWILANGPIPEGLFVCHRCDNPGCIRVDHLFLGEPRENTQDSLRKGRHGSLKQAGKKRGPYRKRAA